MSTFKLPYIFFLCVCNRIAKFWDFYLCKANSPHFELVKHCISWKLVVVNFKRDKIQTLSTIGNFVISCIGKIEKNQLCIITKTVALKSKYWIEKVISSSFVWVWSQWQLFDILQPSKNTTCKGELGCELKLYNNSY